jgi:hypothetical protein
MIYGRWQCVDNFLSNTRIFGVGALASSMGGMESKEKEKSS